MPSASKIVVLWIMGCEPFQHYLICCTKNWILSLHLPALLVCSDHVQTLLHHRHLPVNAQRIPYHTQARFQWEEIAVRT